MDKIEKFLKKLNAKECIVAESLIAAIYNRKFAGLDIKKLTGQEDIYRVRKGEIRVIFLTTREEVAILAIGRRKEDTYDI